MEWPFVCCSLQDNRLTFSILFYVSLFNCFAFSLIEFISQVENLLASKYFCCSRNCVSSTVNMLLQWSDLQLAGHRSLAQRSWSSRYIYFLLSLFWSPSFRSIFLLSLFRPQHSRLSFNKTHLCRVCFVFKLLATSRPSCGKTYFALSPFRLQNYRSPVGK